MGAEALARGIGRRVEAEVGDDDGQELTGWRSSQKVRARLCPVPMEPTGAFAGRSTFTFTEARWAG